MAENIHALGTESSAAWAGAPTEPFACPECGQMLAPECRICVACRQPIDFAKVSRLRATPAVEPVHLDRPAGEKGKTQFSWPIFLVFVGCWIVVANVVAYFVVHYAAHASHVNRLGATPGGQAGIQGVLGVPIDVAYALYALQLICACWVFLDARRRPVPRPWRWAVLTGLPALWLFFFPWYLSRRRAPQVPCPLIEAQISLLFRASVLFVLLILVAAMIFKSPR
jgi:hypothetical protein